MWVMVWWRRCGVLMRGCVVTMRSWRSPTISRGCWSGRARGGRWGLVAAVRRAYARLRGHYAFVAVANDQPDLLVGARKECPLVIGRGDGEQFVASGIPAFLAYTREVQVVEDGEIVALSPAGVEITT